MAGKSFYDLDYMIEINEQRLGEYSAACEKVMDRLTNILVIYSAMTIFLVPIILMFFGPGEKPWWLKACFLLFAGLFSISIFNTVRLIIPVSVKWLREPKVIYKNYRMEYEKEVNNRMSLEVLLKASYINELEDSLLSNIVNYKRKNKLYRNAIVYMLVSIVPYLVCLSYHISIQEIDSAQNKIVVRQKK